MIKRKRGEKPQLDRFGLSLAIGVVSLVVLSLIGAVVVFTTNAPQPMPVSLIGTATLPPFPTPFPTLPPLPSPTLVPMPTDVALLPVGGTLVYGTIMHEIGSFDGDGLHSLSPKGDDVTVSPDGQKLAYVRTGRLFVNRDDQETPIETRGTVRTPVWNADGTALFFVLRQDGRDTVYRWPSGGSTPLPLLSVPQVVAPPLPVPGTHDLVIAELIEPRRTAFYRIDALCASETACRENRVEIATVPHTVAWAAFHPSRHLIFFTDSEFGTLYALDTGSQAITPMGTNHIFKRRVATGGDFSKLVYTDTENNLYLLDIASDVSQKLMPTAVASVSWAGGG